MFQIYYDYLLIKEKNKILEEQTKDQWKKMLY